MGPDRALVPQHRPQVRHVALQRVHHGGRRVLAPDRVGQLAGADDFTGVQRQNGKHRLAAQATDRPCVPIDHDIDGPEKTNLHGIPRLQGRNPLPCTYASPPRFSPAAGGRPGYPQ